MMCGKVWARGVLLRAVGSALLVGGVWSAPAGETPAAGTNVPPRMTLRLLAIGNSGKHCTTAGKYLAALVWYETLFGDVHGNVFVPKDLSPEDAAVLRDVAHKTVREGLRPAPVAMEGVAPAAGPPPADTRRRFPSRPARAHGTSAVATSPKEPEALPAEGRV
jgi:hypothetical protein